MASGAYAARSADDTNNADAPRALPLFDQTPTVGIFGLPRATGYTTVEPGHWATALHVNYTSHYRQQSADGEQLLFDGETTRAALVFKRGFGDRWQAMIEVPFVTHSGGFADHFINDYHDFFGFPDGGRSQAPNNEQHFTYRRHGKLALDVSDSPSGIGDIRLGLKKRLSGYRDLGMSVAGMVKVPTGDADKLTGSGATDVALWGTIGNNQKKDSPWRVLFGGGGLYTGKGDVLRDQRVQTAAFGWTTVGYAFTQAFVLKIQAYAHTPFYDHTDLEALEGNAVEGTLGFDWNVTRRSALDVGITEDLNSGASPDVSFAFGLRHDF